MSTRAVRLKIIETRPEAKIKTGRTKDRRALIGRAGTTEGQRKMKYRGCSCFLRCMKAGRSCDLLVASTTSSPPPPAFSLFLFSSLLLLCPSSIASSSSTYLFKQGKLSHLLRLALLPPHLVFPSLAFPISYAFAHCSQTQIYRKNGPQGTLSVFATRRVAASHLPQQVGINGFGRIGRIVSLYSLKAGGPSILMLIVIAGLPQCVSHLRDSTPPGGTIGF